MLDKTVVNRVALAISCLRGVEGVSSAEAHHPVLPEVLGTLEFLSPKMNRIQRGLRLISTVAILLGTFNLGQSRVTARTL